jgi:hypothetical protein
MGEIIRTKIKSIYGDLRGLLGQIPTKDHSLTSGFIVSQINETFDKLTQASNTDYSNYKIPISEKNPNFENKYSTTTVRTQVGRVISRLEEEYGFNQNNQTQKPNIVIMNKNENEISLRIDYSINDLIQKTTDEESKSKLNQLETELKKPDKNWEIIKQILIWMLNFSKELFLEVIPIILQKKL